MRIHRFRVLIDHPDEAFRDIEIGSEQNFLDLHQAIKDAFGFTGQEMASFYVSDDEWSKGAEIPLADLGFAEDGGEPPTLMDQVTIGEHVSGPAQRFIYAYDFLHMWMFLVELVHTGEAQPDVQYPRVVMRVGTPPDEHSKEIDLSEGILEEEDPYAGDEEEYGFDADDADADMDDDPFGGGGEDFDDLGDEFR